MDALSIHNRRVLLCDPGLGISSVERRTVYVPYRGLGGRAPILQPTKKNETVINAEELYSSMSPSNRVITSSHPRTRVQRSEARVDLLSFTGRLMRVPVLRTTCAYLRRAREASGEH